jgi:ABC-type branched-subunit amino acid transport system substrate-binding protein
MVLGSARHPLNTADVSAFLLQAQASGAKVVVPANAGGDMVNATKQAYEFGLTRAGQTVVSLRTFITDVNSGGLKAMRGLTFIIAFTGTATTRAGLGRNGSSSCTSACRPCRMPSFIQPSDTICERLKQPVLTRRRR